ncbi:cadmium-translocating P-type ATPase [bacterium]|nr:cadmium-translocating P-type ATPase [bacterium]
MKQVFYIRNLACAECAGKIEAGAHRLPGVRSARLNFASGRIALELDDRSAERKVRDGLARLVRQIEPDAELHDAEEHAHAHDHAHPSGILPLIVIGISAAAFAAGWICSAYDLPKPVSTGLFVAVYLLSGWRVLLTAFRHLFTRDLFDENLLMTLATFGAWAVGESAEAAAVMLFFHIGEYFQALAVERSRRSIAELMDIRPDFANLLKDGTVSVVAPEAVEPGDRILVRPGERVPLDGVVRSGSSQLDTAALTGESKPRRINAGDAVLSGTINLSGVLEIEVTARSADSTVSRILAEVENAANRKSKSENFITRFARIYTPAVFGAAILLAVLPPLLAGAAWGVWIYRALVFLVISCPCALVISVPLSFFAGIGGASRRGILFKGGNYLETLAGVKAIAFDKTGTLTQGRFEVREVFPAAGADPDRLLELAAHAELSSSHPIALSLRKAWPGTVDPGRVGAAEEIAGRGIRATVDGSEIRAGSRLLLEEAGIAVPEIRAEGTLIYLAEGTRYLGCVAIADALKPDAVSAMKELRRCGVDRLILLTGDNRETAERVARQLGIDEVRAELLPTGKVACLEEIMKHLKPDEKLAFVGDGINDAPVLSRADVGIAMGGLGSDAAVESADVVLMTDEPSRIAPAIRIARRTLGIVRGNIALALGIKGAVLLAGAFGFVSMWGAVFADVGVTLLAILNALRALGGVNSR